MNDQLTALDATFLELEEADESAHMHIGGLMVFEPGRTPGAPPLDTVRRYLSERTGGLPRYRRRLSEPHTGGLSWPVWELDDRFDIENHVRRAAVPAPGGEREVLEWLGDYWSHRLDRNRPLWDVVVLEGMADGRWALATRTHHSLVDGVGSVDAAHLLLDSSRRGSPSPAPADPEPEPRDERPGILRLVPDAARAAVDVALHPRKAVKRSAALAELIVRDEVVAAPASSINVPIGTGRRFEAVRADLAELKAIKTELGGSLNDVVLAVATGGLRKLMLSRRDEIPSRGLRAMVPVNVRTAGDRLGMGNKIASLFVHLPVAEPDPLRRYRMTTGDAEELKHGNQGTGSDTLIKLAGVAPPILHSFLARALFASRLFNVTITNVPGPQEPLYAFGCRMEEVLPLVPLAADHAVGIAAFSYDGKLFFGLNGDDRAAADLHVLRAGIEESIAELRSLARTTTKQTA